MRNCLVLFVLSVCFGSFVLAQDTIRITCVGNSITEGYGLANPETEAYPAQLQQMLDTQFFVSNFGVSARTMLKHGDLPYWNEVQFTNALESNPNIVIIKLGTNDSKRYNWNSYGHEYVSNYTEMIRLFRELDSKPEIYICTAIPGQNMEWDIYNSYITDSLNPRILDVAFELGVSVIDLYSLFKGRESELLLQDSVHPNIQGAAVFATEVAKCIMHSKPDIISMNGSLLAPEAYGYQWYCNGVRVSDEDGGQDRECIPEKEGMYTVLIQFDETCLNMIVTNEYVYKF